MNQQELPALPESSDGAGPFPDAEPSNIVQYPVPTHGGRCRTAPLRGKHAAMANAKALFRIGDAAEEDGNYLLARHSFERGAALGHVECLCRLAYLFDVGSGVATDKVMAMRLYRRAWQLGSTAAGANIAILYREQGNWRAMLRWWKRVADTGDGSAQFEMARYYLVGVGVRRNPLTGLRYLARALAANHIFKEDREAAVALLHSLRPRQV